MDVTLRNFKEVLPGILGAIREAAFVALDVEMTGLKGGVGEDIHSWDSHQIRYTKTVSAIKGISLLQIGICPFRLDAEQGIVSAMPYNIFLFPRVPPDWFKAKGRGERFFSCQASSLSFLENCGFDFNKCIREGISFVTEEEANYGRDVAHELKTVLSSRLAEQQGAASTAGTSASTSAPSKEERVIDISKLGEQDKLVISKILEQIQQLRNRMLGGGGVGEEVPDSEKDKDFFLLEPLNPFLRKIVYQETKGLQDVMIENLAEDNTLSNGSGKVMRVTFASADRRSKAAEEKFMKEKEKLEMELEGMIGANLILSALAESKKPVIVHNCYLDIVHLLKSFHMKPPASVDDFCQEVQIRYPILVDTKVALTRKRDSDGSVLASKFQGRTGLKEAYDIAAADPDFALPHPINLPEDFKRYTGEDFSHEAGFDAFMTGTVFLRILAFLKIPLSQDLSSALQENEISRRFTNKIFYMGGGADCLNLTGENVNPSTEHILTLSNLSAECRNNHLRDITKAAFPSQSVFVDFAWESDDRCHLVFPTNDLKSTFLDYFMRQVNIPEPLRQAKISEFGSISSDGETNDGDDSLPNSKRRKI